MPRFIAFLRAINVAGHATVKMGALQKAFQDVGCDNVKTVIQSGNVVFEAATDSDARLFGRIESSLARLIGRDVTVVFRTAGEIQKVILANPFDKLPMEPDAKRYVTFLSDKPLALPRLPLVSKKDGLDVIQWTGKDAFVVSRRLKAKGMYGFPNHFIEKQFGVPATTRNWSTVLRIGELLSKKA